MAFRSTPKPPESPAPAAAVVEAPKPAPRTALVELPPTPKPSPAPAAFDPKALARLAAARDALAEAKANEARLRGEAEKAHDAHEGAKAALDRARAVALDAATALVGSDLADNFVALSDDEAKKLAAEAAAARKGVREHSRAKLLG